MYMKDAIVKSTLRYLHVLYMVPKKARVSVG